MVLAVIDMNDHILCQWYMRFLNICHPVIIMVSIMLSFSNFNLNSITICTQFFLAFSILTFYYN